MPLTTIEVQALSVESVQTPPPIEVQAMSLESMQTPPLPAAPLPGASVADTRADAGAPAAVEVQAMRVQRDSRIHEAPPLPPIAANPLKAKASADSRALSNPSAEDRAAASKRALILTCVACALSAVASASVILGLVYGLPRHARYEEDKALENVPLSFRPGELSVHSNGMVLSSGLAVRRLATSGKAIEFANGKRSALAFHHKPDGAAVFAARQGGWVYVSNSELDNNEGGTGAIRFNKDGEMVDYYMILVNTTRNCNGGKTPWNTWLSCEEFGRGHVWETDPFTPIARGGGGRKTAIGDDAGGGTFEAVAIDDRKSPVTFYVTEDEERGALRQFTPRVLGSAGLYGKGATTAYLRIGNDYSVNSDGKGTGTFSWTADAEAGQESAMRHFPYAEGIVHVDGILYFTSKKTYSLFRLDLDAGTLVRTDTRRGRFTQEPDGVIALGDTLYFAEDGALDNCGVTVRDGTGGYYTLLEDTTTRSETSGLAFSPDAKRFYLSFMKGDLYEVTRKDGRPFGGPSLPPHYIAS
jgi:hypothetical protein